MLADAMGLAGPWRIRPGPLNRAEGATFESAIEKLKLAGWAIRLARPLLLGLAALMAIGCSTDTRHKVLSAVFDGVPAPGKQPSSPPTRRVRRDLLREIEDLKRQLDDVRAAGTRKERGTEDAGPPIERVTGWAEALRLLPKDAAGNVDWDQALTAGVIAPRPGPEPQAREQAALDLDVDFAASTSAVFHVSFSHGAHTRWLTCASCHPAPFPLKTRTRPTVITMASLEAGRACGACHGAVAFGIASGCARCHAKVPARAESTTTEQPRTPLERAKSWPEAVKLLPVTQEAPDWTKAMADGVISPRAGIDASSAVEDTLDEEVVRVPGGDQGLRAVFPHKLHTALLKCESCHPSPFEMQVGATQMSMDRFSEGKLCGACHGTVAFPLDACARCHPGMNE